MNPQDMTIRAFTYIGYHVTHRYSDGPVRMDNFQTGEAVFIRRNGTHKPATLVNFTGVKYRVDKFCTGR